MKNRMLALALVAALAMSPAALSQSLGWMRGEAAGFFTDRDWALLRSAIDEALDGAADGEAREWQNESSGASGRITPLRTETRDQTTCRRLRIESLARGARSSHRYLFCRLGDGPWALGQPREPAPD